MTTLADVPLTKRAQAVVRVIKDEPGMSIPQRYEILQTALWPSSPASEDGR